MRELVERGHASLNVKDKQVGPQTFICLPAVNVRAQGWAVLCTAIRMHHMGYRPSSIVRKSHHPATSCALISNVKDTRLRTQGQTAVFVACAANSRAAALYLASKGADVEVHIPLCVEHS